jgi:DNA-directed RNA polymerase III subunit RPC2
MPRYLLYLSLLPLQACAIGGGLLRIVGLVLYFVFMKLAGTEKARYRLWAKQNYEFGTNVANHTMTLLLGLAFTVLAPLIAPFCLLYFSLALLAQKYQLIYVVTLPYQASGRMWMNVSGSAV